MPTIDVDDTQLAYTEIGDGPEVLIFQHGYLGSIEVWDAVVPRLAERYRCIVLDARGIGRSGRPDTGYTVARWADDVIAVADALGIDRFTYVGHSMGSLPGYLLSITHPERLERLVVTCPSPAGPPRAGRAAFAPFRAAWEADDTTAMGNLLAFASVDLPDRENLAERAAVAVTASAGHVDDLLDAVVDLDLREGLSASTVPTFVIVGAADAALKPALDAFALLPDATLHVFSGVGHVPQVEIPEQYVAVLSAFLAEGVINFQSLLKRA